MSLVYPLGAIPPQAGKPYAPVIPTYSPVIPSAPLSFRAHPCHSERSEESPPSRSVRGPEKAYSPTGIVAWYLCTDEELLNQTCRISP